MLHKIYSSSHSLPPHTPPVPPLLLSPFSALCSRFAFHSATVAVAVHSLTEEHGHVSAILGRWISLLVIKVTLVELCWEIPVVLFKLACQLH